MFFFSIVFVKRNNSTTRRDGWRHHYWCGAMVRLLAKILRFFFKTSFFSTFLINFLIENEHTYFSFMISFLLLLIIIIRLSKSIFAWCYRWRSLSWWTSGLAHFQTNSTRSRSYSRSKYYSSWFGKFLLIFFDFILFQFISFYFISVVFYLFIYNFHFFFWKKKHF